MPVLAIDAATMVSSAAVATEERLLSEVTMQLKKPQSEVLIKWEPHTRDFSRELGDQTSQYV